MKQRIQLFFQDSVAFKKKSYVKQLEKLPDPIIPSAGMCELYATANQAHKKQPLLSREDERTLFHKYNWLKKVYNQLLAFGASEKLLAAQEKKIDHLCEYICRMNMALILSTISRNRARFTMLDLHACMSAGHESLLRSIRRFNVDLGNKFSTYAVHAIINGIGGTSFRAMVKAKRMHTTELVENIPMQEAEDRETDSLLKLRELLTANTANLTPVEKSVLDQRFAEYPKTLQEIGEQLGVTKERVRQIQEKALARLRELMKTK